ncbi:LysR family transcriptional regulator [Psychromonas sp. SP041]|uniref:LysR family transcriptional regulator n=1 Tax=Psychromonas sp. SP041 TaxID=1365007 RepID=UPI00046F51BE|nr:LysR family transcriptional regulator [Psychromonas sp. SP041]
MNNISNIQLFVNVVEKGSFSAVARSMEVTPSAVSRQISQLEKELGARLFQRTTRKQSLTEAGDIYFQHAKRLVDDIEVAKLAVKKLADKPSGRLRITAEADFALTFIEPILPEFLQLYPEIQISINMNSAPLDLIDENLDLALRIGHLDNSSLTARKLGDSQSVICASPNYLLKHGQPTHPHDLQTHNCLSFNSKISNNRWRFEMANHPIEVPIKGSLSVNSLSFLRKAALKDLGIIMIPKWMVHDELLQESLTPILEAFSIMQPSTPINAIFTNKRQLAPKTRAFIDFLTQRLAKG